MSIYLLVKTHRKTGLKYLCKRDGEDYLTYPGSGKKWKKHLKKYGVDLDTEVLLKTDDKIEFKKVATELSIKWNIVESKEWANMKLEEGDGGSTNSGKKVYNNGKRNGFFLEGEEPSGWIKGRWDKTPKKEKLPDKRRLVGVSRSEAQILASTSHANKMQGKTPYNRQKIKMFGEEFVSLKSAVEYFDLSYSQYYFMINNNHLIFNTPEELKNYIWDTRNKKISDSRKNGN
jgi:hypothetical protein